MRVHEWEEGKRAGRGGAGVYGNVAEIYHSGLTVQFLLSKFRKAWR